MPLSLERSLCAPGTPLVFFPPVRWRLLWLRVVWGVESPPLLREGMQGRHQPFAPTADSDSYLSPRTREIPHPRLAQGRVGGWLITLSLAKGPFVMWSKFSPQMGFVYLYRKLKHLNWLLSSKVGKFPIKNKFSLLTSCPFSHSVRCACGRHCWNFPIQPPWQGKEQRNSLFPKGARR